MFKGDKIKIKETLLGELVQQEIREHRIELGMPMQVKENRSSVITVMGLDVSQSGTKHPAVSVVQNYDFFKDKMLLMQAQENGVVLDEEELLFLASDQTNTFDADVDDQPVRDLTQNDDNIFQADECDAFDSDVDDEPTAQSIFMA
ncbi:hypothetical protein Tco_0298123, partial [Tanacetum coccineum]